MKPITPPLRFAVLAADTALFTFKDDELYVRMVAVNRPPHFVNVKGLPGGLLHPKETAEQAAVRHVEEKARVKASKIYVEQLYTFSALDRDPRGRVVAVAYLALVPWELLSPSEQSDTKDAWWAPAYRASKLAYDHNEMLAVALTRLKSRATYTTLVNKLMSKEFTLSELERVYSNILKTNFDKRNFRKKIRKLKILSALLYKRAGGAFRPATLYKFASDKVKEIEIL